MGIRDWLIRRELRADVCTIEEGKMGPFLKSLWHWLNGWKTVIGAILLATELLFPGSGFAHYIDLFMAAVGWNHIAPAVDPGAIAEWGTLTVGLVHKFTKAASQIKAGIALRDVHP